MNKVLRYVLIRLDIEADPGVNIDEVISECDYSIQSTTKGALIRETEITDVYEHHPDNA